MRTARRNEAFWFRWLVIVTGGVMVFGLLMLLAPGWMRQFFSLLLYSDAAQIDGFGGQAVPYITLAHGVLGSVMFGWGAALLFVLLGPFRSGKREGWQMLAVSIAAWFIPDTLFSLITGFWPNALLNAVIAVLFAIPLAAMYRKGK